MRKGFLNRGVRIIIGIAQFDERPFSFKNILKRFAKRLWLNFTLN
jgi:hypothetical protein